MKATTHIGFAALMYLLFFTTAGIALSAVNAATVACASVLPDVDSGGSHAGRVCPPLTRFLERKFGHRTLTHSFLMMGILALLLLVPVLLGCDVAACFLLGYMTHPFLDTCTPNGVRLFFPFSRLRCVFPFDSGAPHRFRIESGSKLDAALGAILWLSCVPALYVANLGYERFIRLTQHSVESAVRDYESFSPSSVVRVAMKARNAMSGEVLEGKYTAAGALDARTLIFVGPDGRLHSVGRDFAAEYTADNIVCERGEPAAIEVREVDMRYQVLGDLFADSAESYCFGDVATAFNVALPLRMRAFTPVEGSGKRLRLKFARKSDIDELGLGEVLAISGAVVVRTLTRPGSANPTPGRGASPAGGALLTCVVNPGETLELRKKKGDAVGRGDTLAVRRIAAFFNEEAALNERKLASARNRARAALNDLRRAIAGAVSDEAADSAGYAGAGELARRGFIARAALGAAAAKWERSRRRLGRLLDSRDPLAAKCAIEEGRLRLAVAELRARAAVHAMKCGIIATASGTLAEIRRDHAGDREKVSFVIRESPP